MRSFLLSLIPLIQLVMSINSDTADSAVSTPPAPPAAPAFPILTPEFLDKLEETAYTYDDGAEIAEMYGPTLSHLYKTPGDPQQEQAGLVISICLRNNELAAQNLAETSPELAEGFGLDRRSLSILSAFVSTEPGRLLIQKSGALDTLRLQLNGISPKLLKSNNTTPQLLAKGVSSVLRTLGSAAVDADSDKWCEWVATLQQTNYITKEEQFNILAREICDHANDFSELTVKCRAQPGLRDAVEEQKRAAETEASMPNSYAARNHFDL